MSILAIIAAFFVVGAGQNAYKSYNSEENKQKRFSARIITGLGVSIKNANTCARKTQDCAKKCQGPSCCSSELKEVQRFLNEIDKRATDLRTHIVTLALAGKPITRDLTDATYDAKKSVRNLEEAEQAILRAQNPEQSIAPASPSFVETPSHEWPTQGTEFNIQCTSLVDDLESHLKSLESDQRKAITAGLAKDRDAESLKDDLGRVTEQYVSGKAVSTYLSSKNCPCTQAKKLLGTFKARARAQEAAFAAKLDAVIQSDKQVTAILSSEKK